MLKMKKCCNVKYYLDWDGSNEGLKIARSFEKTVLPGFNDKIPDGFILLLKPVITRVDDYIDTGNSILSLGLFDEEFEGEKSIYHRKMAMVSVGGLFGNNVISVDVFNGSDDKRRPWSLRELVSVFSALRDAFLRVRGCDLMWWGSKGVISELLRTNSKKGGFEVSLFIDNAYSVVRRGDVYQFKYSLLKYGKIVHVKGSAGLFGGDKLFEFRKSYYGQKAVNVISLSNLELMKSLDV